MKFEKQAEYRAGKNRGILEVIRNMSYSGYQSVVSAATLLLLDLA